MMKGLSARLRMVFDDERLVVNAGLCSLPARLAVGLCVDREGIGRAAW